MVLNGGGSDRGAQIISFLFTCGTATRSHPVLSFPRRRESRRWGFGERPMDSRLRGNDGVFSDGCLASVIPLIFLISIISIVSLPAQAVGLNDSGIEVCSNGTTSATLCSSVLIDGGTYARQDARYGRDAVAAVGQLPKIGAGEAGFDFTALDASGQVVRPAQLGLTSLSSAAHSCVRDNVSGLLWEVKTDDGGLRDGQWTYSWYNSAQNDNSHAGTANGGICHSSGRCDSEKYVADVNASALCGFSDWRMPTEDELQGIVHYGRIIPSIDPLYFPNTPSWLFWSATPLAAHPALAWVVVFSNGDTYSDSQSNGNHVRLVRGGQ